MVARRTHMIATHSESDVAACSISVVSSCQCVYILSAARRVDTFKPTSIPPSLSCAVIVQLFTSGDIVSRICRRSTNHAIPPVRHHGIRARPFLGFPRSLTETSAPSNRQTSLQQSTSLRASSRSRARHDRPSGVGCSVPTLPPLTGAQRCA